MDSNIKAEKIAQLKSFLVELTEVKDKVYELGQRMAVVGIMASTHIQAVADLHHTIVVIEEITKKLENGELDKQIEEMEAEASEPKPSESDLSSLKNLVDSAVPPKGGWIN